MKPRSTSHKFLGGSLASAALILTGLSAHAATTVWNVNLGSTNQITTGDNYIGAAAENTNNSKWNEINVGNNTVTTTGTLALATSTNAASTATLTISGGANNLNSGNTVAAGDEIFTTYFKVNGNTGPMTVSFASLPALGTGESYSLVIYSDWFFPTSTPGNMPITQTVGTGLTGTFNFNRTVNTANDQVGSLSQDTDAANVATTATFARLDNLTPASNELAFSMTPGNSPVNGFQLILVPEPSAALLGGLGLLALLRRRRQD